MQKTRHLLRSIVLLKIVVLLLLLLLDTVMAADRHTEFRNE